MTDKTYEALFVIKIFNGSIVEISPSKIIKLFSLVFAPKK